MLALSLLIGVAIARILGMIGEEIAELVEAEPWTSAPLTRDFARADEIRDELGARGIVLEDTKNGVRWKRK